MSVEKLKQAMQLIQECIDEYDSEQTSEANQTDSSGSMGGSSMGGTSDSSSANDKIKMAAFAMRKGQ